MVKTRTGISELPASVRSWLSTRLLGALFLTTLGTATSAQLDADFTGTPTSGDNPLTVLFTDTTTGATPLVWAWDFGDGGTSSEQNPAHTYTSPGSYTVSLSVFPFLMIDVETKVDYITVDPARFVADFSASPTQGVNPLQVAFTDTSTGAALTAWSWDFGDGTSSTLQNPTHTYEVTGSTSFAVMLTSFVGQQSDTLVKTDYITVDPAPLVVDFTASATQGFNPLLVGFTDTSTGATITAWSWDFGDGTTSTLQNPSHTYQVAASTSFSVSLTAFVGPQRDTLVKTDYITVDPAPLIVDFSALPTQGVNPLTVSFTDTTTGATPVAWSWDFGDGGSSAEQNPTHTYFGPGSYTVTLGVMALGGRLDGEIKDDYITVDPAPLVVGFGASPAQGVNPLQVTFTDTATGATVTAWSWDFGDGNSSSQQNPTHTYTLQGTYSVSLTAFVGHQSDTLVQTDLITADPAPLVVGFSASPTQGGNPLLVTFTDLSMGAITAWNWDFGDGNSSSRQNPTHTYTLPGAYSVSLTAFIGQQSETLVQTDLITVDPAPLVVGFSVSPTHGFSPQQVAFFDESTGLLTAWSWDFGDGTTSSLQNPTHTYQLTESTSFTVSLTAFIGQQSDRLVQADLITIDPLFGPAQAIATISSGSAAYATDLDGDGDVDVLSASPVGWYENTDGLGSFGPRNLVQSWAGGVFYSVHATDLDGDGDADVLWTLSYGSLPDFVFEIGWNENTDGLGDFGPKQIITSATWGGVTKSDVYATDLDGDGDADVLASGISLAWYENTDGLGSFGPEQIIAGGGLFFASVHAPDLDGDGDADVLRSSLFLISWYENEDGRGTFGPQEVIDDGSMTANYPLFVRPTDVDGDGDVDVLSADVNKDTIAWYENTDGLGGFGPQQIITTVADGAGAVYAADLDGDGDADLIATGGADPSSVAWYENLDGSGSFGSAQIIAVSTDSASLGLATDLDGDGDVDVVSAGKIAWYENRLVAAPWKFLGGAAPGLKGQPVLTGQGPLSAGSDLIMDLTQAPANALMLFRISLTSMPQNVVGGTLYAHPFDLQLLLVTDAAGNFSLTAPVAPGAPSGLELYFQFIVQDLSVPFEITLSNAVMATTP